MDRVRVEALICSCSAAEAAGTAQTPQLYREPGPDGREPARWRKSCEGSVLNSSSSQMYLALLITAFALPILVLLSRKYRQTGGPVVTGFRLLVGILGVLLVIAAVAGVVFCGWLIFDAGRGNGGGVFLLVVVVGGASLFSFFFGRTLLHLLGGAAGPKGGPRIQSSGGASWIPRWEISATAASRRTCARMRCENPIRNRTAQRTDAAAGGSPITRGAGYFRRRLPTEASALRSSATVPGSGTAWVEAAARSPASPKSAAPISSCAGAGGGDPASVTIPPSPMLSSASV